MGPAVQQLPHLPPDLLEAGAECPAPGDPGGGGRGVVAQVLGSEGDGHGGTLGGGVWLVTAVRR